MSVPIDVLGNLPTIQWQDNGSSNRSTRSLPTIQWEDNVISDRHTRSLSIFNGKIMTVPTEAPKACLSLLFTWLNSNKLVFVLVYIRRPLFLFLVQLTIFGICFLPLGYLLLGHLLSGSILNHFMHSKDAECILMFLSAMPRGVSVAHIYVLKLPLHHL